MLWRDHGGNPAGDQMLADLSCSEKKIELLSSEYLLFVFVVCVGTESLGLVQSDPYFLGYLTDHRNPCVVFSGKLTCYDDDILN